MLDDLPAERRIVGTKQVIRAVKEGVAIKRIYVAHDADNNVKARIMEACSGHNVDPVENMSMSELGSICGIDVGAACVALLE